MMFTKLKFLLVVLVMLSLTFSVTAQPRKSDKELRLFELNFIESLNKNYEGIVEKTIYNTIVFKSKFPNYRFADIVDQLKKVAEKEINPIIRYEAQLAVLFIENYSLFESVEVTNQFNQEIFKQISQTIYNKMLAAN